MKYLKIFGGLAVVALFLVAATPAHAQGFSVGIGVGPAVVGPAPVCAYGYYPYYPYACAPYGYYGPQWFVGGVFIGAGPWYHGYWGHPGYWGRPGYYGPRPVPYSHGPVAGGGGFHTFSGSAGFHGGTSFHAAGGFHGGGRR
ncbi:MAG TPA: hypothetical protein VEJ45_10155 [Candidatus Acidoferrales bacterium]|nr:hypothetical protein [Candidatus Acidoferrales bacterium]